MTFTEGADRPIRPVLIAGPTASGKSALALRLAERDGGVVINADALQVYDCWRVLTARPEDADLARAPHRLYGHVPGNVVHSVGAWLRDLAPVLAETRAAGLRPILVGGTGLYLDALIHGLAEVPEIPREFRERSQAEIEAGRLEALIADLAARDPATLAGLDARNPRRVQRAWEVLEATGRGLAAWQAAATAPLLPAEGVLRYVLDPEVPTLNLRISKRFDVMLESGALAETRAFLAADLSLDAPSGRALGARELAAHLAGEMSLDAAREAATIATRQYAKRQRTWFRNRFGDWERIDPDAEEPLGRIPGIGG